MNRLTKVQVIALFLSSASAQDTAALFNAPSDAAQVPEGQTATGASTGTVCNGNADCTTDGEKCALFQQKDKYAEAAGLCLLENLCGAMGRLGGVSFYADCYGDAADAAKPGEVDTDAYLAAIEELTTATTVSWDGYADLIVSPKFNYQDGIWYKNIDGASDDFNKYVEVDKAADNRCFLDIQCPPLEGVERCCMLYPDGNNRRCMAKTVSKTTVTVGPTSIVPICMNETADDAVPENAQDDIAAGAKSSAEEALTSYKANLLKDAKAAVNYDDMTDADKTKFDEAQAAAEDKVQAFQDELRTLGGYSGDGCDDTCKAVIEDKVLEQAKAVYEACKTDADSIDCVNANDLAKTEFTARGADYFSGDAAKREEMDAKVAEDKAAQKASLTAAAIGAIEAGTNLGSCELTVCVDPETTHCCGTATFGTGDAMKTKTVCGGRTVGQKLQYFEETWSFSCDDALKNMASVAAAVAVAYMNL